MKNARLCAFAELEKWITSHNKMNTPAILVGDFNIPFNRLSKYINKHFSGWAIANLSDNTFTYSKGHKSSCIDHAIYNRAMASHFNIASACSSFHGVSDHNPIIVSCKKGSFVNFKSQSSVKKWSTHICNTKCKDILSHNYFSVLANEFESNKDIISADEIVDKFLDTSK